MTTLLLGSCAVHENVVVRLKFLLLELDGLPENCQSNRVDKGCNRTAADEDQESD